MSLSSGTRLGSYEIIAPLGAGGMGEVYRARDTNLGRDVALKTLPDRVTHDPERLARFRREAQVLAALNHPHIASIYGVEEVSGQRFLVLELVEGETLAARDPRGPLPFDEALAIAREIAEALQAAHEKGIIHRDLKPANIALTPHDRVKVLDFGLAKATDAAAASDVAALNSPTITSPAMLTGMGVILGTAAYMSPEQAKGRQADKRSDVWAFGCVLFEMLAGRRPYEGDDVSETLAAVLKSDPPWNALPPSLSPAVRSLLDGCLEKNPRERISDLSTALFVLKHPSSEPPAAVGPVAAGRRSWLPVGLIALAAAIVAGSAAIVLWPRPHALPAPVARFAISVPAGQLALARRALALSRDGTRIVFSSDSKLYLRSLSDSEARLIPGGDPGFHPAFSPDGESVVFYAPPALRQMRVTGGTPITICEIAPAPNGIHWSESGIFFMQVGVGIMRVSPNGGTPELLVGIPQAAALGNGVQLLPDGDTLLFTQASGSVLTSRFWDSAEIVVHSIKSGQRKTLLHGGSDARYLATGHLVYMVEGTMMGVSFDLEKLEVTSGPVPVVEGVRRSAPASGNSAQFEVSDTGTLIYVPGAPRSGQEDLFIYDRNGGITPLKLPSASYAAPRVSPDGKQLVVETSDGKEAMISLYDLAGTSSLRRLTFGGNNRLPIWSADGKHVVFQSDRDGDRAIFWQPVGGGAAERLTRPEPGVAHTPESWLPKGDLFLFSATKGSESTLWTFSMRDRKTARLNEVGPSAVPTNATFSPDGQWIAYQASDVVSGEGRTYVQPYPPTGVKHEIARGGRPMWSSDGTALYLVPGPSQFAVVSVKTRPTFEFTTPAPLPRRFGLAPPQSPRPYDMLPDGRVVGIDAASMATEQRSQQIQVVLNWFEELKSRLPVAK